MTTTTAAARRSLLAYDITAGAVQAACIAVWWSAWPDASLFGRIIIFFAAVGVMESVRQIVSDTRSGATPKPPTVALARWAIPASMIAAIVLVVVAAATGSLIATWFAVGLSVAPRALQVP